MNKYLHSLNLNDEERVDKWIIYQIRLLLEFFYVQKLWQERWFILRRCFLLLVIDYSQMYRIAVCFVPKKSHVENIDECCRIHRPPVSLSTIYLVHCVCSFFMIHGIPFIHKYTFSKILYGFFSVPSYCMHEVHSKIKVVHSKKYWNDTIFLSTVT